MKPAILLVACSLSLIACDIDEHDIGTDEQFIESHNALSMNALSMNALSMNALSMNALSLNAFELDVNVTDGLETTEEGRHVLRYLTKCVLDPADTVQTVVDGVTYIFPYDPADPNAPGSQGPGLGLAPEWLVRPLTLSERYLVTSCMLTHVNAFGVHVPISVRSAMLAATQSEIATYGLHEAAFYGDIFASPKLMYGCFATELTLASSQSSFRQWRVCSDPIDSTTQDSRCTVSVLDPFIVAGPCTSVCETYSADVGWTQCATENPPAPGASKYQETMNVWLIDDLVGN